MKSLSIAGVAVEDTATLTVFAVAPATAPAIGSDPAGLTGGPAAGVVGIDGMAAAGAVGVKGMAAAGAVGMGTEPASAAAVGIGTATPAAAGDVRPLAGVAGIEGGAATGAVARGGSLTSSRGRSAINVLEVSADSVGFCGTADCSLTVSVAGASGTRAGITGGGREAGIAEGALPGFAIGGVVLETGRATGADNGVLARVGLDSGAVALDAGALPEPTPLGVARGTGGAAVDIGAGGGDGVGLDVGRARALFCSDKTGGVAERFPLPEGTPAAAGAGLAGGGEALAVNRTSGSMSSMEANNAGTSDESSAAGPQTPGSSGPADGVDADCTGSSGDDISSSEP